MLIHSEYMSRKPHERAYGLQAHRLPNAIARWKIKRREVAIYSQGFGACHTKQGEGQRRRARAKYAVLRHRIEWLGWIIYRNYGILGVTSPKKSPVVSTS